MISYNGSTFVKDAPPTKEAALAVASLLLVEPLQSSTLLRVAQKVLPLAVSFLIIVPLLLYLYSDMLVRQDTASGMRIPRPKI